MIIIFINPSLYILHHHSYSKSDLVCLVYCWYYYRTHSLTHIVFTKHRFVAVNKRYKALRLEPTIKYIVEKKYTFAVKNVLICVYKYRQYTFFHFAEIYICGKYAVTYILHIQLINKVHLFEAFLYGVNILISIT